MIISPPMTTNDEDLNCGHHVHTRIMISVDSMHYGREVYFCHRWLLPLRYYIRIMSVEACFPMPSTKSKWSSGLRGSFKYWFERAMVKIPLLNYYLSRKTLHFHINYSSHWNEFMKGLNSRLQIKVYGSFLFHLTSITIPKNSFECL